MSIPFIILAGLFFILFLVWVIFSLITIYHVIRYANWTRLPLVTVFVYLFLSTGIIIWTGWALRDVEWSEAIEFNTPAISIPSSNQIHDSANDLLP